MKETKQNAVERIDNLENNLIVKTKLVDDLTEQLEGTLNSAQKALLQHQHEKEMFLKKLVLFFFTSPIFPWPLDSKTALIRVIHPAQFICAFKRQTV